MGKYGDPNDLQDYKGGRDFDALKKFAEENLGPTCGPDNLDLCDDAKKDEIKKLQALSTTELDAQIKSNEETLEKAESDFKSFTEGLQKQYEEASKKKEADVEAIKSSGLGVMKAVRASKGKDEL